jgi:hypothetical protein
MTNLFQLFEEATTAAPPSRLSVDDVFSAMRSRRRRHLRNAVAGLAAVATAVAIGIVWTAGPAGHGPVVAAVSHPVVWAGSGDAAHLYLVRDTCGRDRRATASAQPSADSGPPRQVCAELLASSDGGASWLSRGAITYPPRILGTLTLMRFVGGAADPSQAPDPLLAFELSTDGGATWSRMPRAGQPIEAVPPGGTLVDGFARELMVFDPAQGLMRQLAHPPALLPDPAMTAVTGPSGIWVTGRHRETQRPSVAVSHDSGATWIERELPGAAVVPQPTLPSGELDPHSSSGPGVQLIAGDGPIAYATMWDATPLSPAAGSLGRMWTYRTADAGLTWQAVADVPTTPFYAFVWMAAGGRIVVSLPGRNGDEPIFTFAASTDGVTYAPAAPPGLPVSLNFIDGSIAYSGSAVYASTDGWTWREVWRG